MCECKEEEEGWEEREEDEEQKKELQKESEFISVNRAIMESLCLVKSHEINCWHVQYC